MITLADYWMGRDVWFSRALTPAIRTSAEVTVQRANALLQLFGEARAVNSGWRPPEINASTPGAALKSKHMTGEAIDLADPEGDLDEWCFNNQQDLVSLDLWQEHPASTKGWCHVQTIPPKSGNRVFYP